MNEIYTETIVKRERVGALSTLQSFLSGAAIFCAFMGLTFAWIFLVGAALAGIGWFLLRQNTDVEFEYIQTATDLDIDKVIANSSRKHVLTVELKQVMVVAPLGSPELERFQGLKTRDFSAQKPTEPPYVMVCVTGGNKQRLLLQLNEKAFTSLKKAIPTKVFAE